MLCVIGCEDVHRGTLHVLLVDGRWSRVGVLKIGDWEAVEHLSEE